MITQFHAKLLRERRRGTYQLRDLGNMDQTPPPFVMDDNKTYESKGAKEVWCVTGASGLDKRQCTAQLTIFADGSVLPPLLIFRGQGKRIKTEERRRWDQGVKVTFQPNAWCDENIMLEWVNEQ